jgi:hypothetical protein
MTDAWVVGEQWSGRCAVNPPQLDRIAFRASELQNPWDYLYDVTDDYFCAISPSPSHKNYL